MGPKAYDGSKRPNHMKDDATIEFTGDRRRFLQEHGPKIEEIDVTGKVHAFIKAGARFCMPIEKCDAEGPRRNKKAAFLVVLVMILLCVTICVQRWWFQRQMKMLREALQSSHD